LRRGLTLQPRNAAAHCDLGDILEAQHHDEEALREFEFAARLAPRFFHAMMRQAAVLRKMGRYDDAAEAAGKALALLPNDARAHEEAGHSLFLGGRFAEAAGHLLQAMREDPLRGQPVFLLGRIAAAQGDYASARGRFSEALRVQPDLTSLYEQTAATASERERDLLRAAV